MIKTAIVHTSTCYFARIIVIILYRGDAYVVTRHAMVYFLGHFSVIVSMLFEYIYAYAMVFFDEHSGSFSISFHFFGVICATALMRILIDSMFATKMSTLLMNQWFKVNETRTCDPGRRAI